MATRKRRSSILKSKPRAPLQELEFNPATPTQPEPGKSRRVSFSKRKGVAEFVAHDATTTWRNLYEEQNRTLETSSLGESQHQQRWPSGGDGNLQEVEAELGSFTVTQDINITQQIASLEGACATERLQAQSINFSAITDQNIQFNDDFGNPHLTQTTGRIDLNYSMMPPVHNDFECVQDDVKNYENLNTTGYIEVDLNTTHITSVNASDMSITDIIQSPKFQVEAKNVTVEVTKDWITDKENILVTPIPKITEKNSTKSDDQILVFDGKKIKYAKPDDPLDEVSGFGNKDPISIKSMGKEKLLTETNQVATGILTKGPRLRQTFAEDGLLDFTLEIPVSTNKYTDDSLNLKEFNMDILEKDTPQSNIVSSSFINTDVPIMEDVPSNINTNNKTDTNYEKAFNVKDKRKTINFSDEDGNMSYTQVIPQLIEKRKSIKVNDDDDNMSITKVVSHVNENVQSQSVSQIIDSKNVFNSPGQEVAYSIDKRKTINFNNEDGNMSMTQVIPQVVDKINTFSFNPEDVNMSMTQVIPQVIDKRKTINFNNEDGNISMTQLIPQVVDKINTFSFNPEDVNMSMTQVVPQVIDKRMTINFKKGEDNMSITKVVSHPIDDIRASDSNNESINMSLTQFVHPAINNENNMSSASIALNIDKGKTINFNNEDGSMSMTQVIPETREKRRTILFDDVEGNMSVTQLVPGLIDTSKLIGQKSDSLLETQLGINGPDKMKTLNFTGEDGKMLMTQVISEDINELKTPCPTNEAFDMSITEEANMSMTQAIPQVIEKRKTINDHIEFGNMSMTQVVSQTIDKGKTINCSVNMSMTQLIPQAIDTSNMTASKNDKRKTINFNDADMSMTQIAPQVIDNIKLANFNGQDNMSMTQALPQAYPVLFNKTSDGISLKPDKPNEEISMKEPSNLLMDIQNLSLSQKINVNFTHNDAIDIAGIKNIDTIADVNDQILAEKNKLLYLTDISNLNCPITPKQVLVYSSYEDKNAPSSKTESTESTSTVTNNCNSSSCSQSYQSDTSQSVKCKRQDSSVTTTNTEEFAVKIKTVQSNLPNMRSLLDNFIPENIHPLIVRNDSSVKTLNQAQSCDLNTSIDFSSPARKMPRFSSTELINAKLNNNEQIKISSDTIVSINSTQIEASNLCNLAANISQPVLDKTGHKKSQLSDFLNISESDSSIVIPIMNKSKAILSLDHMTETKNSMKKKDDDILERSRTYHNLDNPTNVSGIQDLKLSDGKKEGNIVSGSEKTDLVNKVDEDHIKTDVPRSVKDTSHIVDGNTITEDLPLLLMESKSADGISLAYEKTKEGEHTNEGKNNKSLNVSTSKNQTIPFNSGDRNSTRCENSNDLNSSDLKSQLLAKQPLDLSNKNIKHEQIVFNVAQSRKPFIDTGSTKTANTEKASSGEENQINESLTNENLNTSHAIISDDKANIHSNKLIGSEIDSDIVTTADSTVQNCVLSFDQTTDTDDLPRLLMESKSADCISLTYEKDFKMKPVGQVSKSKNNKFLSFFKSKIRPTPLNNVNIIEDKKISHNEDSKKADSNDLLNESQKQTPLMQEQIVFNAQTNSKTDTALTEDGIPDKSQLVDDLSKSFSINMNIAEMKNSEPLTCVPDGTTQTDKVIELPKSPTKSILKYPKTPSKNENKSRSLRESSYASYSMPKDTDRQSLVLFPENCKTSLTTLEKTNLDKTEFERPEQMKSNDTIKEHDHMTSNLEDTKYLIDMLGKYSDSIVDNKSYAPESHPLEENQLPEKGNESIKGEVVNSRKSVAGKANNLSLAKSHITTIDSSGTVDAGGEKHIGIVVVTYIEDSLSPKMKKHNSGYYKRQKESNELHDATVQECNEADKSHKNIEFRPDSVNENDEKSPDKICENVDEELSPEKKILEGSIDSVEATKRNLSEVSALKIVKEESHRVIVEKATSEKNKHDELTDVKENEKSARKTTEETDRNKNSSAPTNQSSTTLNLIQKTIFDTNSQDVTGDVLVEKIETRTKSPVPKLIESVGSEIDTLKSIGHDNYANTAEKCITSIYTSNTKHKVSADCSLAQKNKEKDVTSDVAPVENFNLSTENESYLQPATSRRMKFCEGLVRALKFSDDSPLKKPTDEYEMDPSKITAICTKCNVIPTDLNDDRINNIKSIMYDLTKPPRETLPFEECVDRTDQQMTSQPDQHMTALPDQYMTSQPDRQMYSQPRCLCSHRHDDDEDMSWINYNNPQSERGNLSKSSRSPKVSPRRREVRFGDKSSDGTSPAKRESRRHKPLIFDPKNPLNNVLLSASYIARNSPPFNPEVQRVSVTEPQFSQNPQVPITQYPVPSTQEELRVNSDTVMDKACPVNTECPNVIDCPSAIKCLEHPIDTEYPVISECTDDAKLVTLSVKQDFDTDSMKSNNLVAEEKKAEFQQIVDEAEKSVKKHRGTIGKKAIKAFKNLLNHKPKALKDQDGVLTDEEREINPNEHQDSKEYISIDINPVSTNDLSIQNSINQIIKTKETKEKATEIRTPSKLTRNASIEVDLVDRHDCRLSLVGILKKGEVNTAVGNTDHESMLEDTTPILIDESNTSSPPTPTTDASTGTNAKPDPTQVLYLTKATLNLSESENEDIASSITPIKGIKRVLITTPNRISTDTPQHTSKLHKQNSPQIKTLKTSTVKKPVTQIRSPKKVVNNEKCNEPKTYRDGKSLKNTKRSPNKNGRSPSVNNVIKQFNREYVINSAYDTDTQKTAFTNPDGLSQNGTILSEMHQGDNVELSDTTLDNTGSKNVIKDPEQTDIKKSTNEKAADDIEPLPKTIDMDISMHEIMTEEKFRHNLNQHESVPKLNVSEQKISNPVTIPKMKKSKEAPKKNIDFGVKVAEMSCFGEHCSLEVQEYGTWRLHLIRQLTLDIEFDTVDAVAEDTPVKRVATCPRAAERDIEAELCARALESYGTRVLCDDACAAGALPARLSRVAAACALAARWLRAMRVARLHIAYTLLRPGVVGFTVVNTSLDAVYDVKMELGVNHGSVVVRSLEVECVYGELPVGRDVLDTLRRQAHCQWGHVPTLMWKVFRLLKSDNLKAQILSMK